MGRRGFSSVALDLPLGAMLERKEEQGSLELPGNRLDEDWCLGT